MRRRRKRRKKNNGVIVKEATGPALGAAVVSLLRNATRRSLLGKEARATARGRRGGGEGQVGAAAAGLLPSRVPPPARGFAESALQLWRCHCASTNVSGGKFYLLF